MNKFLKQCSILSIFLGLIISCNQRTQIIAPKTDPFLAYYESFQHISKPSDSLKIVGYDGKVLKITYKSNGIPISLNISKTKDSTFFDRSVALKIFSGWLDTTAIPNQWTGASIDFDTLRPGIQNFMTVQSTIFGINRKAMMGLKFNANRGDSLFFR